MNAHEELVRSLMPEVFQSERSATRHPRVEARRLGAVPPAEALVAVADHADAALEELGRLAATLGLPGAVAGRALGTTFSLLRENVGDRLIDQDRSYRGTLLGVHHGIGAVRMLGATAAFVPGFEPLVGFCDNWLATRSRLADACLDQIDWFAAHPEAARVAVWTGPLRRLRYGLDGAVAAGMRRGFGLIRA